MISKYNATATLHLNHVAWENEASNHEGAAGT